MHRAQQRRRDKRLVVQGGFVGEDRTGAKLTRVLVDAILDMREEHGLSYGKIQRFLTDWHDVTVSIRTIRGILDYRYWISRPQFDCDRKIAPTKREWP